MFKNKKSDKEWMIRRFREQSIDYAAKAMMYLDLAQYGDKELRYHYMKLHMAYNKLYLDMEHIVYTLGGEPNFDIVHDYTKGKIA